MKFATVDAMRRIEERSFQQGTSYDQMMLEAGEEAARILLERMPLTGKKAVILCGKGNNGGDGFVVARCLAEQGALVTVVLVQGPPATDTAQGAFRMMPQKVEILERSEASLSDTIKDCDLLVDALYGIGFRGALRKPDRELFQWCAQSRGFPVALDLPSGVEGDTGRYESCFPAHLTIAMACLKPVHLVSWRKEYTDEVLLARTPLTQVAEESGLLTDALEPEICAFPRRLGWSHKGTNGRLLLICGSAAYPGAAVMACGGALRAGTGYVTLASTLDVCREAGGRYPGLLRRPLHQSWNGGIAATEFSRLLKWANESDAVVMGCGMENTEETKSLVLGMLQYCKTPLILDADALNALAGKTEVLRRSAAPLLLTPHPGEFSRLTGTHIDGGKELADTAAAFSRETGAVLLLKGAVTWLYGPDGEKTASFLGNSGLARGGSGDVLAGILGAMAARGLPLWEAARCGLVLQGMAAQAAARRWSREGMLPTDVIDALGEAFLTLEACRSGKRGNDEGMDHSAGIGAAADRMR